MRNPLQEICTVGTVRGETRWHFATGSPLLGAWQRAYKEWLVGQLRRHNSRAAAIELQQRLDLTTSVVPDSYTVEPIARFTHGGEGGEVRRLSMLRSRRYALAALQQHMDALGWEALDAWNYSGPQVLALFRRCSSATEVCHA